MSAPQVDRIGLLAYGLDRPLSGIGRYAVELTRALDAQVGHQTITLLQPFKGIPNGLGADIPSARLWGRLLPTLMVAGPPQIALAARRRGLALVHDPMGISPFLIPRRVAPFARVVTIHDMVPFIYPETHAPLTNLLFRYYIPRTLRFVDRIVTDSVQSQRDISRFFHLPERRITVIPCGVGAAFTPIDVRATRPVLARYGVREPYILTVGALQARKNLETLFDAYRLLRQYGFSHQLVVVGKRAWKTEGVFQRLRDLGFEDEVLLTGYVTDEDLPTLYSGAAVFAFPSLYEGFGLPPLEAMACGTPVVTSNASSLPEVVGDAGIMVDPLDVRGFTEALVRLLNDPEAHASYRTRGLVRARAFAWENSARQHAALYQEVSVTRISYS